jgi:hypothetical protein
MTPRPLARTRRAALGVSLTMTLMALVGCDPRQAMYFLQPFDPQIGALSELSLKDKRVVLIVKANTNATNDFATLDRDLTREIAKILRANVKRVDIVDQEKVWAWDRAHPTWTDPAELAEPFDADYVIFYEVNEFEVANPSSPELFQGKSNVRVQVVERAHPKDRRGHEKRDQPLKCELVYSDEHVTVFPTNNHMPATSDFTRGTFRRKFLSLVATELSWYFIEHAPGDNIQDSKFTRDQ